MPFFAAQVDEDATTFGPEHHVRDLDAFHAEIDHQEGDCATLKLDVRNPRRGLLSGPRWFWLSWYDLNAPGSVYPIFFGRIVGVPTNLLAEVCTIEFDARPGDFVARKNYVANALRFLPWYDEIFIDEKHRAEPDSALETRSVRWHIDRVTLEVTTSDILAGEEGIEEFIDAGDEQADIFDLQLSVGQAPLSKVRVEASVPWTAATAEGNIYIGERHFFTYAGGGILGDWPKIGANIGGGWTVAAGTQCRDVWGVSVAELGQYSSQWKNTEKEHLTGDPISVSHSLSYPTWLAPHIEYALEQENDGGVVDPYSDPPINRPAKSKTTTLYIPLWHLHTYLWLNYTMANQRSEGVAFDVRANLQPIVTLTTDEDTGNPQDAEVIAITGANVGVAIGSEVPIGDTVRRSYFETERGQLSLEYLILLARARLREKARCVSITFSCRWERAINLSCRKNALVRSPDLPGGEALGKIVGYKITADGDSGVLIGQVTMLCAVGYGDVVEEIVGVPTVLEEEVVEPDVQKYEGFLTTIGEDIGYTFGDSDPGDDGLVWPLRRADVVVEEIVSGVVQDQEAALDQVVGLRPIGDGSSGVDSQREAGKHTTAIVSGALAQAPIVYQLRLRAVSGLTFVGSLPVEVAPLAIPQMINLEAYG